MTRHNNVINTHTFYFIILGIISAVHWIGTVQGLQNLTFFYHEQQHISSGATTLSNNMTTTSSGANATFYCNTTLNACSDLSQIRQYLDSLYPPIPEQVNEFNIQIFLMSNLTKLESITRSANVIIRQLSFISYLVEDNKRKHIASTNVGLLFSKGLERLTLNSIEVIWRIRKGYHIPDKADWIFESCYIENTSISYSGSITISQSLIVHSTVHGAISLSIQNSKAIGATSLTTIGTISISENSTLTGSVVTSYGITLSRSQFTSCTISSESHNILLENSTFNNCFIRAQIAELSMVKSVILSRSLLYMIGIGECSIMDSTFSQGSNVSVVGGNFLLVQRSNFTQNSNALSMEKIKTVKVEQCNFIGNINCVSYRNDYIDTGFDITSCLFQDNWSKLGGALYVESASVLVRSCKFLNNKASNGGAIYLKSSKYFEGRSQYSFFDIQSHYSSNEAVLSGEECELHPETCGNGGVFFSADLPNTLHFFESVIENNKAIKGGICYNCRLDSLEGMVGNKASYSGDTIFFGSEIQYPLPKFLSNTSLGSKDLSFVEWKVVETGKVYSSNDFNKIRLYPGEVITIEFTLIDWFENQLKTAQALPSFNGKSLSTLIIREVPDSKTKLSLLFSYELYQETTRIDSFNSIDVNVVFSDRNYSFKFMVEIEDCPFEYSLEGPQTNRVCTFRNYSAIIISVVFGVIIALIVLGLGVFGSVKISQKLIKLHRKEKTEKRIAKKLIDKKFVFGDDIPLLINRMKDSHWSNIIIPIEDIEILKRIGEGSNGTVYLASWNGIKVALKSIKSDAMDVSDLDDEFEHEASLLNGLKHPSIVRFYGISISESSKYMVVEYLENGSLESGIQASKLGIRKFDLRKKIQILKGISSGMDYLHSLKPKSIVHRDLKPGNILLDSNMEPKVCDFGLSKTISNNTGTSMTMNLGTILYMAPELIGSGYPIGNSLDVYSFGIIMYELFFEERPFIPNPQTSNIFRFSGAASSGENNAVDNNNQLFSIPVRVVKGERPKIPWSCQSEFEIWIEEFVEPFENNSSLSSSLNHASVCQVCIELIDLMKKCWHDNPNTRPTFKEITQILNTIQMKYKSL